MLNNMDEYIAMIGHNRWATVGTVSKMNAHPFKERNITLVHNGTIYNHKDLPLKEQFPVDSMAIAHNFAHHGPEEIIPLLHGGFTFIWHNSEDNTINFIRNDDRPLALAVVEKTNTMLLASEVGMMKWLASRETPKLVVDKVWTPQPYTMITYPLDKDKLDVSSPKSTKLKKKVVAPVVKHTPTQPWERTGGSYVSSNVSSMRREDRDSIRQILAKKGLTLGEEYIFVMDSQDPTCVIDSPSHAGKSWLYGDIWLPDAMNSEGTYGVLPATISDFPNKEFDDDRYDEGVMVVKPGLVMAETRNGKTTEYIRCKFVRISSWEEAFIEPEKGGGKDVPVAGEGGVVNDAAFPFRGPRQEPLTQKEFEKKYNSGMCISCSRNISAAMSHELLWANEGRDPVCPDCANLAEVSAQH